MLFQNTLKIVVLFVPISLLKLVLFVHIDTSFPANGDLPFVQVDSPILYVLVEWSDYAGSRHHTYLEYNYKTYSVKPEAKAE